MASVAVDDVRDVINVSSAEVPDAKVLKMIKRAEVTLELETGAEMINVFKRIGRRVQIPHHPPQKSYFPLKNGLSVIIREAEVKDAEGIINAINSVGAEKVFIFTEQFSHDAKWEQAFIQEHVKEKKDYLLAVAEVNGKIVGVCYVHQGSSPKDSHVAELGLNVIKGFRETGIGTAMMIYMIDWAKNRGARKLCLGVFSTNQQAINLYKKFNFRVEGTRKKLYKVNGKYVDEIIMGRFLKQSETRI